MAKDPKKYPVAVTHLVRVTSYRRKILPPGSVCFYGFVDPLIEERLIPKRPERTSWQFIQVKVFTDQQEHSVIEIFRYEQDDH